MIPVKSFETYINLRKRGVNINSLILEMRNNKFSNEDIQKIIDTEGRVEKFQRKYNVKETQNTKD